MPGHVEMEDLATPMLDDEEAVERLERDRRNGEEVERGDHLTMVAEKGEPALGGIRRR
jgi:hypothetical protein